MCNQQEVVSAVVVSWMDDGRKLVVFPVNFDDVQGESTVSLYDKLLFSHQRG